jgi:hypothetical protein
MNIHRILGGNKFWTVFAFSIVAVVLFLIVYFQYIKPNSEHYKKCICSSNNGTERNCQDTEVVQKNYEDNKATEFTDLKPREWSKVSSGDYNYPVSNSCNWKDDSGAKNEWVAWDFTDF